MANLTSEQLDKILKNKPSGATDAGIIASLRSRGHTLPGEKIQEEEPTKKDISIVSAVKDTAIGAAKGAASTLQGIGKAVIKPISKITGIQDTSGFSQEQLTPTNTAQKVGKGIEQVAEFFVPATGVAKITKGASTATKIAGQVLSDTLVAKGQGAGLKEMGTQAVLTTALSSLPVVGKLLGKPIGKSLDKYSKGLEEMNLRLTPTQKQKLKGAEDSVISFIQNNKITGNPSQRYQKSIEIVDDFEDKVQSLIKESGKKYSKDEVKRVISSLPESYLDKVQNPEVYSRMKKDVQKFINFIDSQKSDFIDATRVNSFKRQYAKNARNKAGDTVLNESREAISDGLYVLLQKDIPGLKSVNKDYSTALLVNKLLGKAIGRNELGLIGNIVALATGASIGSTAGPVASAIGAAAGPSIAGKLVGTATRSRVSLGLNQLAEYLQSAKKTKDGSLIIPRSIINSLLDREEIE